MFVKVIQICLLNEALLIWSTFGYFEDCIMGSLFEALLVDMQSGTTSVLVGSSAANQWEAGPESLLAIRGFSCGCVEPLSMQTAMYYLSAKWKPFTAKLLLTPWLYCVWRALSLSLVWYLPRNHSAIAMSLGWCRTDITQLRKQWISVCPSRTNSRICGFCFGYRHQFSKCSSARSLPSHYYFGLT